MHDTLLDADTELLMLRHVVEALAVEVLSRGEDPVADVDRMAAAGQHDLARRVKGINTFAHKDALRTIQAHEEAFWQIVRKAVAKRGR